MKIERSLPLGHPSFTQKPAVEGFSQSFQEHMDQQQEREDLQKRAEDLMEDLSQHAADLFEQVDFLKFEEYRRMIGDLIRDILNSAYVCQSRRIATAWGKPKIYSSVVVIDDKLDEIGNQILSANSDRLLFLSKVDEIRGLVMDMLL